MNPEILSAERLRQSLTYNPDTGVFVRHGNCVGALNKALGYIVISLNGVNYLAHRLAWLYVHGEWPEITDHVNGDRTDNRLANLRSAGSNVNNQNRRAASKRSKSGVLGVCWDRGRWVAHIMADRKRKNLGRYKTIDEAQSAYLVAKRRLHAGCTI